jgi:SpoVK/Ycf46/Vps4 family AAA+-type ATPase
LLLQIRIPDTADRRVLLRAILPPAFALNEAWLARLSVCTSGFVAADLVALKRHAVALALAEQRRFEKERSSWIDAIANVGWTHSQASADAGEGGCARPPGLEDLEAALPHIRPTVLRGENLQVGLVPP